MRGDRIVIKQPHEMVCIGLLRRSAWNVGLVGVYEIDQRRDVYGSSYTSFLVPLRITRMYEVLGSL